MSRRQRLSSNHQAILVILLGLLISQNETLPLQPEDARSAFLASRETAASNADAFAYLSRRPVSPACQSHSQRLGRTLRAFVGFVRIWQKMASSSVHRSAKSLVVPQPPEF